MPLKCFLAFTIGYTLYFNLQSIYSFIDHFKTARFFFIKVLYFFIQILSTACYLRRPYYFILSKLLLQAQILLSIELFREYLNFGLIS